MPFFFFFLYGAVFCNFCVIQGSSSKSSENYNCPDYFKILEDRDERCLLSDFFFVAFEPHIHIASLYPNERSIFFKVRSEQKFLKSNFSSELV